MLRSSFHLPCHSLFFSFINNTYGLESKYAATNEDTMLKMQKSKKKPQRLPRILAVKNVVDEKDHLTDTNIGGIYGKFQRNPT